MCCLVQVMCSAVWEVGMSELKVENISSAAENYTFAAVKRSGKLFTFTDIAKRCLECY